MAKKKLKLFYDLPDVGTYCVELLDKNGDVVRMKFFNDIKMKEAFKYAENHRPSRVMKYTGWDMVGWYN